MAGSECEQGLSWVLCRLSLVPFNPYELKTTGSVQEARDGKSTSEIPVPRGRHICKVLCARELLLQGKNTSIIFYT